MFSQKPSLSDNILKLSQRLPVDKANNITVFKVKHFISNFVAGDQDFNKSNTNFTDQVGTNFFTGGLLL